MGTSSSLAVKLRRWEVLGNRLEPLLDELPQTREPHVQLMNLVGQVKDHADEEVRLRGLISKSVAERRILEGAAADVRGTLASWLRAHYGSTNEQLLEFGIPISRPGRRAKAVAEKAAVEAASQLETTTV